MEKKKNFNDTVIINDLNKNIPNIGINVLCSTCRNLLCPKYMEKTMLFECNNCGKMYNSTTIDSLRYDEQPKSSNFGIEIITKNIASDPVNMKIIKKCTKCSYMFSKRIQTSNNMKSIFACIKCNNRYV